MITPPPTVTSPPPPPLPQEVQTAVALTEDLTAQRDSAGRFLSGALALAEIPGIVPAKVDQKNNPLPNEQGVIEYQTKITDFLGIAGLTELVALLGPYFAPIGTGGGGGTPKVHLLIEDGQSNMTGYDGSEWKPTNTDLVALSPDITREFQRVFIWNPDGTAFQKLKAGVNNRALNGNSLDITIGVGQCFETHNATDVLYIVKAGWPGEQIEHWAKGATQGRYEYLVNNVAAAKAALNALGFSVQVDGIVWNQWESNRDDTAYGPKLAGLMSNLIADGVMPATARQAIYICDGNDPRAAQLQYVADHASIATAIAIEGYQRIPDQNIHYSNRASFLSGTDAYNAIYQKSLAYPVPMVPGTGGGGGTTPPAPSTMEQDDTRIYYSHDWTRDQAITGTSGGTQTYCSGSDTDPFMVGITFTGTQFSLSTLNFNLAVKADVYIDGVKETYSYQDNQGVVERYKKVVANGTHQVQIVARYPGTYCLIDKFDCIGTFVAYSGSTTVPAA